MKKIEFENLIRKIIREELNSFFKSNSNLGESMIYASKNGSISPDRVRVTSESSPKSVGNTKKSGKSILEAMVKKTMNSSNLMEYEDDDVINDISTANLVEGELIKPANFDEASMEFMSRLKRR